MPRPSETEKELHIGSAGATALVTGPTATVDEIAACDFLSVYVPLLENAKGAADCTICLQMGDAPSLEIDYPAARYTYSRFNAKEAIALAEFMLERARQEKGILCIHGACAIVNGRAVITVGGASGIGKTSLAVETARLGGFLLADEKVLIDLENTCVIGGVGSIYAATDYWKQRLGQADYAKIEPPAALRQASYPIAAFIYPCLVPQDVEATSEKWSSAKFDWHLWEESCRKIRGVSRRFFDYTLPAPSLDTAILGEKRAKSIKNITNSTSCYYVQGGLHSAALLVSKLVNQQLS